MAIPPFENTPINARSSEPAPGEEASGPAEQKILKAMDFYQEALRTGPRLPREVLAEGKELGHTKRTQERARARLHVQKIPPERWQGPWMIALPNDPAVEEAKNRKKAKEAQRNQRKGNGRLRKQQGGGGSQTRGKALMLQ